MASGKCGKNLTWSLSNDRLVISGTGEMENFKYIKISITGGKTEAPWYDYSDYGRLVKKIIICDGVTSIGNYAFFDLGFLTEIKIPDSVTSIGDYAFAHCGSTEIKIPDGVTSIGKYAFNYFRSLTSVTIPDSVKSIGERAFADCNELTSIKLSKSITSIDKGTFDCCSRLKAIEIPNSVTTIDIFAIAQCRNLVSVIIPDSVTTINNNAFYNCRSLTSVRIPESVKSIGEKIFEGCTNLREIHYPAGRGFESALCERNNAELIPYSSKNVTWKVDGINLTVGGANKIKDYSKEVPPWNDYLRDVQRVIVEDGVTEIAEHAFSNCVALEHVTTPASLHTIGDFAFAFSYCGEWNVNNRKNVIWSLERGTLIIKKNPDAANEKDFSIGDVAWKDIEKNITGIKIECGVMLKEKFFEWLWQSGRDIQITFA